MAQHGSSPPELQRPPAAPAGPGGLALVHRTRVPRPPATAAAAATTTATAGVTTAGAVVAGDVVTLTTPRPDTERVTNEYVETPFRPATAPPTKLPAAAVPKQQQRHHPLSLQLPAGRDSGRDHQALHLPVVVAPGKRPPLPPAPHLLHHHHHHHHHPAHTFEKEGRGYPGPAAALSGGGFAGSPPSGSGSGSSSPGGRGSDGRVVAALGSLGPAGGVPDCFRGSIICPECGRCRCESCRKPRPLPSRWLCDNSCYCSAETALDYATCLCCVKGLFYHCCRDHDLEGADEPCACGPPRCAARWGCLCALSLALPCLWCYWPLRALLRLCEACYRRHSAAGCRCRPASSLLLAASPDF